MQTVTREVQINLVVLTQVWAVADKADRAMACEPLRRDGVVDPEVGAHRAEGDAGKGDGLLPEIHGGSVAALLVALNGWWTGCIAAGKGAVSWSDFQLFGTEF